MGPADRPLTGKVAWVTGSSRGLGRVIATHLGQLGASIVVHGTTPTSTRAFGEADSLASVVDAVAAETDGEVLMVHGDLTDPAAVERIVGEIVSALARSTFWSTTPAAISAQPARMGRAAASRIRTTPCSFQ